MKKTLKFKITGSQGQCESHQSAAPMLIGSHLSCDVYIPASANQKNILCLVSVQENIPKLHCAHSGKEISNQDLADIGVSDLRVLQGKSDKSLSNSKASLAGVFAAFLLGVGILGFSAGNSVQADGFEKAVALQPGVEDPTEYLSEGTEHQYQKGVAFEIDVPESWQNDESVLRFSVRGVQTPQDFVVLTSDRVLFQSSLDPRCLEKPCGVETVLPKGSLKTGRVEIQFLNKKLASNFGLTGITLNSYPAASSDELQKITETLSLAKELFEQSQRAKSNIVQARRHVTNGWNLIQKKRFPQETKSSFAELRQKILTQITEEFQGRVLSVESHLRLGNLSAATEETSYLKLLFPDDTTRQGRTVLQLESHLKNLEARRK